MNNPTIARTGHTACSSSETCSTLGPHCVAQIADGGEQEQVFKTPPVQVVVDTKLLCSSAFLLVTLSLLTAALCNIAKVQRPASSIIGAC